MSNEIWAVLATVRAGVVVGDAGAVQNGIADLEFFVVEAEGWPGDLFDGASDLLNDVAFLGIPTSESITLPRAEPCCDVTCDITRRERLARGGETGGYGVGCGFGFERWLLIKRLPSHVAVDRHHRR